MLFFQFAPKNRYGQGKCPDCGFLLQPGATSCPLCSDKRPSVGKNTIILTVLLVTLVGLVLFFYLAGPFRL